jgi:type III secretion protein V
MVMRPDLRMRNGEFGIYVHELPVLDGKLQPGCVLCVESDAALASAGIPVKEKGDLLGNLAFWVAEEYSTVLQAKRLRYLHMEEVLERCLQTALSQYAHEFIGVQESQFLLKRLEQQYPELEKELRQQVPLPRLADILRRLVQEHISVRDLRLIAQTLVEYASREKDNVLLTECVRNSMARYITYQYTLVDGTLPAIVLAPALEENLKQYIKQTSTRSFLLLPEALRESMTEQIDKILQSSPDHAAAAVLLVNSIEIRPHLRAAIADEFHGLPVLAIPQLEGALHVRSLGQVC